MNIKKKVIILVSICLIVLAGAIIADMILGKSYFKEISSKEILEKIENKEDVVLLISQTTCTHCISYKPKLRDVANDYKINIYYIDVDLLDEDESSKLKEKVNFTTTPVTVFLKNGEEKTAATRINGDASKEKIIKKLKNNGFID